MVYILKVELINESTLLLYLKPESLFPAYFYNKQKYNILGSLSSKIFPVNPEKNAGFTINYHRKDLC